MKAQYDTHSPRVWEAQRILLGSSGAKPIDLTRQLILIYLADRECWAQLGQPLIVGPILATYQYGPVNSPALKALKSHVKSDAGARELSKAEAQFLQQVAVASQHLSTDELLDRACALPEWRPPLLVGGDVIPLERVLVAVGYTDEDARLIAEGHDAAWSHGGFSPPLQMVSAVA